MGSCNRSCVILRTVEQDAHYIRKSLIYSTRKVFLERIVIELDYKFDEKSTVCV